MMDNIDRCPICGSNDLTNAIELNIFNIGDKDITIDNLEIIKCMYCDESFYTDKSSKRIESILSKLKNENY